MECPQCGKQVGNINGEVAKELLKQKRKRDSETVKNLVTMYGDGKSEDEIDDFIEKQLTGEQMADETGPLDPA